MNVLVIKHVDIEGPGLIEYCLNQAKIPFKIVNPSTSRDKCRGLLRVDPERRFPSPPSKAGLSAVERVNLKPSIHLPKLDDFSHIVFLGGPMNVYEEDRYPFLRYEDLFIKEAIQRGKTVLGICLGAQLIAKALGAKVFKAPMKEIGWYDVTLTEEGFKDPFFSHLPTAFPVFQWHEDTFEIPKSGKLIATSSSVSHQAFRYGETVYGLQFHLEVTEEMIKEWMKTYEEELKGSQPPLFSKLKILTDTAIKIETYTRRGMEFLKDFFGYPMMAH